MCLGEYIYIWIVFTVAENLCAEERTAVDRMENVKSLCDLSLGVCRLGIEVVDEKHVSMLEASLCKGLVGARVFGL